MPALNARILLGPTCAVRRLLVVSALGIAATCSGPSASFAANSGKSASFHSFGSYQTYDMADVNEAMRSALSAYPGSRADKDKIDSGAGFGGGLRIWPTDRVFVPLEAQRILASNSGSGPYFGQNYTVELNVPAVAITTGVGYVLLNRGRIRFALSAGAGYYVCTGEIVTRGPGLYDRSDLEGSGFGFHGLGVVFTRIVRRLDLELAGGYRHAKTTDVTISGRRLRNADGSLAQIDWSGITGRAGLSVRVSGE